MKISSTNNYSNQMFTARRVSASELKAFFKDPKNIEIIKKNQEYSAKVSKWVADNINVKDEYLNKPFI